MNNFSLLHKFTYEVNDNITINIPKVGDIWDSDSKYERYEKYYLSMVSLFTQTPTDMMIELDDMGLDWTEVDEYSLFIILMSSFLSDINNPDFPVKWNSLFLNLDYKDIVLKADDAENNFVFINSNGDVIFNKQIYNYISDLLCAVLLTTKNREYAKVPEIDTRKYILERARLKRKRRLERLNNKRETTSSSALDGVILFLVNNNAFKYNFETVKELSIYDLYASFKQINKNQEIDGLMTGYWYGNVDLSKISDSKLKRIIL